MLRGFKLLVVVVLTASLPALGQGGNGTIQGTVKDEKGETMALAGVLVEQNGTRKSAVQTDFDGGYKVSSLAPGVYDVIVKYAGYADYKIAGVKVNANKITFLDIDMPSEGASNLDALIVKDYEVPLIDRDGGATGGTVTRDDIAKMPGRSATSIATTVGGVYQDAGGGGGLSVRGSRSDATYYFIDGIKVRGSTNLPKSAIEEVSVVTGGLPANYGDATGGIISVTTRGPSSFYFGGIDVLSSGFSFGGDELGYGRKVVGLDSYAYNLVEGSISGPLLMKKDSTGEKTKPILGFFLSGNFVSQLDPRPSALGHYRLRQGMRDSLLDPALLGPLRASTEGSGALPNAAYLGANAFEYTKWAQNAGSNRYSAAGKIDVNTTPTINLTFGGQFDWNDYSNFNRTNSLFNWENNADVRDVSWRAYGRFTQRFFSYDSQEESNSKIKNAFYTVMVDYSKQNTRVQDNRHKDNFFNYGYVGHFETYRQNSYEFNTDNGFPQRVHNGFEDTLVVYTPSEVNTSLAAQTEQYFTLFDESDDNYENLNQVLAGGGLRNGDLPQSIYGVWSALGTNYNGYSQSDNSQFRITASGSADIGDHAVTIGFEFEQRADRFFSVAPVGLWTRARLLANNHIRELDLDNPMITQFGSFQQIDYNRLNASPGDFDGGDAQAFFDYNMRLALGLDPDGVDFVNVDAIDPALMQLDWFSADELLNDGNNFVTYYGYDYNGNKLGSGQKPSFDDFFNKKDEFNNFTRDIGAFEPIYISGYIMDKFAFDDLVFNVGVRVDRFDANQNVLKDPWLLHPAKTVSEVTAFGADPVVHPENMEGDYVVYVNDINNPSGINGYRRLNDNGTSTWFDANGVEILDPSAIETGAGIAPYLVGSPDDEISSEAFEDYTPQIIVMPRIAFSFPISDEALFFAHYDILSKRPTSGNRLDIMDYFYMENRNVIANNPNLKPERTIDYELGFQQVLSKSSSLKISAFYREQRDQVALINITGAYPRTYRSWGNIDFGTVKGITVAYDLRRTGNIWMRASYTLQFAEGTGSDASSALNLVNSGQPNLRTIYPYNYDQRHRIVATIDYRYGEGKDYNGPTIKGKQIFKNTGINLVSNLGSGTPYSAQSNITPEGNISGANGVLQGQINGSRKPGQFRMDAQLDRNIVLKMGKGEEKKNVNMNIYLLVNNVFNTNNIVNVYRATGNPNDDGYLNAAVAQTSIQSQLDEQAFREMYALKVNNFYNYGIPRTIRLGVKLDF